MPSARAPVRLFSLALLAGSLWAQAPASAPVRVLLRGGPKTHGEGEHDHPRWAEEFAELLRQRGAEVDSTLVFPSAAQLARADVLVLYAAEGASIRGRERVDLEAFLARGGGLVALHDAVCGDDPHWFKTVAGGAWEHGHSKYHTGAIDLYFTDREHPITAGAANFRFEDEIYYELHMDPNARVLASAFPTVFDVTPQAWVLERGAHRAFVSLQGHYHASFSHQAWRAFLLRGVAWAAHRDVDLLLVSGEREMQRYPPGGPLAPEAAAAQLELHPDFELSLLAAEDVAVKPISIDWDARGRAWVALTPGYPEKQESSGRPARDEIAILTDVDERGRARGRKTFFRGLDLVTSLVHYRDGVIVSAAPEILLLRDRDGDDVADQQTVLFRGFGYGDTHATLSNLRWGPDGWIYATQGYSGNASRNVIGADGVDHGAIGNGLLRFRPDGSAIELVSAYGSNTWGLDFASDGELFFSMANGAHLRHVVLPERVLQGVRVGKSESWADVPDHERVFPLLHETAAPYVQIDFVGGFTAAAGCTLYTGGAWPEEWNDAHFVCEPTVNLVHHDVLAPKGVSFRASKARQGEFLAGRDLWFRPVHTRVGPDGALYVLDFYNQAVVHNDTRGPRHGPTNAALRPDRDHSHGRIWRVQHRRARGLESPELSAASEGELVKAFEHPNAWVRNTALRLLRERGLERVRGELQDLSRHGASAAARSLAAWALAQAGPLDPGVLGRLLLDPEESVRKAATAVAGQFGSDPSAPQIAVLLANRLLDPSPRVQLLALAALGDLPSSRGTVEALLARWGELTDDWSKTACLRALSSDPELSLALLWGKGATPANVELAGWLGRVVARRGDAALCSRLVQLAAERSDGAADLRAAMLRELAAGPSGPAAPAFSMELERALRALLEPAQAELALAVLPLASRWDGKGRLRGAVEQFAAALAELLEQPPGAPRASGLSPGAPRRRLARDPGRRSAARASHRPGCPLVARRRRRRGRLGVARSSGRLLGGHARPAGGARPGRSLERPGLERARARVRAALVAGGLDR
jgi:putative membrane-bound dehydrogenase-like protein